VVEEERPMTLARDEILQRIRAIDRAPAPPSERGYRAIGSFDSDARIDLFATRVADYRADVHVLAQGAVAAAIESACLEHGAARVGVPPALPAAWRPQSVELVEDQGLTARELDTLDGVVTGCTVAIAETGTIVLAGGSAEGRRASRSCPTCTSASSEASRSSSS
jgi:L-lactate dehydrogenase complex protein LldG